MAYSVLKLMTMRCFVVYLMHCKASVKEFNATSVRTPTFCLNILNTGDSSQLASSSLNYAYGGQQ